MKWIVFLALPLILLGCGGGSSSGGESAPSDGGRDGQPADIAGLWDGQVNGRSAAVLIDTDGSILGYWTSRDMDALMVVSGKVPMSTEGASNVTLCEHGRDAGQARNYAPYGPCENVEWSSSAVGRQTIQGELGEMTVELAYREPPFQPVAPNDGCRTIDHFYMGSSWNGSYTLYSPDSTRLNILSDGTITGSRTREIARNAPVPGPVSEWSITGSVASHHLDGVSRMTLDLDAQSPHGSDGQMDGIIWDELGYFVPSRDGGSPLLYQYDDRGGCE